MTVGTTRLHEKNAELFARLSQEMRAAQAQVGSGLKDLRLSKNLHEIARLSAAEEKKAEEKKEEAAPAAAEEKKEEAAPAAAE